MALFRKKPAKTKPAAGPSLTPVVTLILADVALRAGQSLVQNAIERGVLKGQKASKGRVIRGRNLTETVVGTVLAEVARRSVPGAILVGCGVIAQTMRNRARAQAADAQGDATPTLPAPGKSGRR